MEYTLLENHTNSQKVYMCGDYMVDLLKLNSTPFNENYFDNILSACYISKIFKSRENKIVFVKINFRKSWKHFFFREKNLFS